MKAVRTWARILAAAVASALCGLIFFVVLGILLPIWTMILIYGQQEVQDAPAHGGIILFATVPIAGMLALICMFPLGMLIYQKLSN